MGASSFRTCCVGTESTEETSDKCQDLLEPSEKLEVGDEHAWPVLINDI